MLAFRALHNIDLTRNLVASKQIPPDFAAFTNDYLAFARENETSKRYTAVDTNTQVLSCVCQILQIALSNEEPTDHTRTALEELAKSIAMRLFRTEIDAQEKIAHMNKFIKKGSLVQALVMDDTDDNVYLYIVAKVEHSEWFDGESLQKSFGFPTEKKNVWKSAVIPLTISEDEIHFGSIRIYTDNEARYWSKEFLEVVEEKSDETNTKTAFEAIDRVLRLELKKEHPRDYYVLRNTVIQAMKTPQLLDYNDYIESLLGGYVPEDRCVNTTFLKSKLLQLPEKKKFDTQFTTVPKAIVAHKKLKFEPTDGIVINVDGSLDDYKEVITACVDDQHRRVLMIRCSNPDTFKAFGGN